MMTARRLSSFLTRTGVPMGLLLVLVSCYTFSGEHFTPKVRGGPEEVKIEVSNHSYWDLRVYLERQGVLLPLGRVDRMQTITFALSEGMLANALQYALVTKPVSEGKGFRTEVVAVFPGWLHRWTLLPTTGLFHGTGGQSSKER
jgi:hypothetical protein